MLQIALPNKGALSDDAIQLAKDAGYRIRRDRRDLAVRDAENGVEFIFLRPRDIATYVSKGILDLGVTGRDLAIDSQSGAEEVRALGFGKSRFQYAVPKESDLTPDGMEGMRIATSYVHLVEHDLQERGLDADVVPLDGAVEISIRLGVADAIADVVQTGRTLDAAGLKTTGEPILYSEAVLVARDQKIMELDAVKTFVDRIDGILLARDYVMIEYDIEEGQLDDAVAIAPGIESPTVAPLSKAGWVAVKAMIRKHRVNRVMDALSALGAKGIIVTGLQTCRL